MTLDIAKLTELVMLFPDINQLKQKLDSEINKQKELFIAALKNRGLDQLNPHNSQLVQAIIEREQIDHARSLYQEMAKGLAVPLHELENRINEVDNPQQKAQLVALQQQLVQVSQEMQNKATALQMDEQARHKELEQQKQLQQERMKEVAAQEQEKKRKEQYEKEKESVEAWRQLLQMILPPAWEKSWEEKANQRLNKMEAELSKEAVVLKTPEEKTRPHQAKDVEAIPAVKAVTKNGEKSSHVEVVVEPSKKHISPEEKMRQMVARLVGSNMDKSGVVLADLPITEEAKARQKREAEQFRDPNFYKKKSGQ